MRSGWGTGGSWTSGFLLISVCTMITDKYIVYWIVYGVISPSRTLNIFCERVIDSPHKISRGPPMEGGDIRGDVPEVGVAVPQAMYLEVW